MRKSTKTLEQFIIDAENLHGKNVYDYSLVNYINNSTKVDIICPIHDIFSSAPRNFLYQSLKNNKPTSCQKCGRDRKSLKLILTNTQFIEKANLLYDNYYDYSLVDYKGGKKYVDIICPIHGIFNQRATNHLEGKGCLKCGIISMGKSQRSNTIDFIEKAIKKHGDKFDYSKSIYTHSNKEIILDCKIHGEIKTTPFSHLQSKGCIKCFYERRLNIFNKSGWVKATKDKICIFYIIKCWNNEEEFLKLGITSVKSVNKRYWGKCNMPYNFEILKEIKGTGEYVWDLEKRFKRLKKKQHYIPKLPFGGSITECFKQTSS